MYTTCRVGVLSSEISKNAKISPPSSLSSHLTSSPMGVFSGDYCMIFFLISLLLIIAEMKCLAISKLSVNLCGCAVL